MTAFSAAVCLISPGLPSSNPRLVKEAAALSGAGYRVHCVVGDYATPLRAFDEELLTAAGATFVRVGLGGRAGYRARRLRQVLAERGARYFARSARLAAWAASTQSDRLGAAAGRFRADLYIGHTLGGLPAAVQAADRRAAIAGFDAEDFHPAETGDRRRDETADRVVRRLLPECRHLTAASPQIGEAFEAAYGVSMTTVLNVFPRPNPAALAAARLRRRGSRAAPFSLYWFSQTVGPGRGLEQLIRGAALAAADVRLALRGIVGGRYRDELARLAAAAGLRRPVEFLPPAHPDDMFALAAEHDAGLSLELSRPPNRGLALTNKFFTYLQAGLPQLVSRTAAQEWAASLCGEAALLVDVDDPGSIAAAVDAIARDPARYDRAASEARRLADERYCWEVERERLLETVEYSLSGAAGRRPAGAAA